MVHNYELLQKKIASSERHSIAYWTNLIKKTLDDLDEETLRRTGLPKEEKLVTFEEYRAWARALGRMKGWSHEQ